MRDEAKKIDWWKFGKGFSLPLLIFLANLIIVAPLLLGEYSSLAASEQPVFLKIIDFLGESRPSILWANFWQGGFSLPLFFTPIVPLLSQISAFFGLAAGQSLRIISALSYALIPLSLYFLVTLISRRKVAGFIAAVFFSLHPSVMGVFSSEIRSASLDYSDAPWRFIINILGDTPHLLSLTLIPVVGAYFLYTLRKTSFRKMVICSGLIALTALVDFVSLFSLLILLFVITFSEVLLTDKTAQSRLGIFVLCLIVSFGLFSFWYNPSFIKNFFTFGPGLPYGSDLLKIIPYLILFVPWVIIGLFYIFGYRKHLQSLFIAIGWFTFTFFLSFSYFFFGRSFVPMAERYLVEMNMAFAIVLGILAAHFYDWLGRVGKAKHRLANFFRHLFIFGVIFILVYYSLPFLKDAWQYNRPSKDISQTKIYEAGQYFKERVKGDSRVFISSPENHWFSLFSDRPQISNPLRQDQHQNSLIRAVNEYFSGPESGKLLSLAQATNTEYFVVPKSYESRQRFKDLGQLVKGAGNYEIYKVSLANTSLVQKINTQAMSSLSVIDENFYGDDLAAYLAWRKEHEKEKVDYEMIGNQKVRITGELKKGEGYLIKMNYDPGFRADKAEVKKDPFGFIVLFPSGEGEITIELKQGLSLNQWIGIDATILTVFFLLIYRFKPRRKILRRGKKEFNIP